MKQNGTSIFLQRYALWALRITKNSKTKFSSFELLYGRRDTWPLEIMFPDIYKDPNESEEEYIF